MATMAEISGVHIVRYAPKNKPVRWYIYAWRGGPRIAAVEQPHKPKLAAQHIAALDQAMAGRRAHDTSLTDGALAAWQSSPEWKRLAPRTRKLWGNAADRIEAKWGKVPLRVLSDPRMRPKVVTWRNSMQATPRTADIHVQVLSSFLEWAMLNGLALANPARAIPKIDDRTDRAPVIWLPADIAAIRKHAAQPLQDALALAELTGLRRADLVALRWDEVGEFAITRRAAKKSRGRRLRVTLPRLPALDALLQDLQRRYRAPGVETVLVNSRGKSFTGDGLGTSFTDARTKANGGAGVWHEERDPESGEVTRIKKRLHDFRGTFATHLMTHGTARLTDQEIADMMAWSPQQVAEIRKRYVDDAAIIVAIANRLRG